MEKLLKMADIYYKCSAVSIDSKYLLPLNQFVVECIAENIGTQDDDSKNEIFISLASNGGLKLVNQLAEKMTETTDELSTSSMDRVAMSKVRGKRWKS